MYSKKEASRIKHEFWTTFGRYMTPILSAEGLKINWVNYHTSVKNVFFRMDTNAKSATIAITIEHNDPGMQELFFEQFRELKFLLESSLGEEWNWQKHVMVDDKLISRIEKTLEGVSVMNRDHWSDLISFFKPRIIALDEFWQDAKYSFDDLK